MTVTTKLPDCKNLNIASVKAICGGSDQVMIYGAQNCKYREVTSVLEDLAVGQNPPLRKVYNWVVGSTVTSKKRRTTLEGRHMHVLSYEKASTHPRIHSRPCKTAITELVLENYKRIEEGRAIIPLLFCIDIDGIDKPISMESITTRDTKKNAYITLKELRRAYKLCQHENPKIRRAAEATLKFVKLKYQGNETYALEQISAPWAHSAEADEMWAAREKSSLSKPKPREFNWRSQLDARVEEFEKSLVPKPPLLFPSIKSTLTSLILGVVEITTSAAEKVKAETSLTRFLEEDD